MRLYFDSDGLFECTSRIDDELRTLDGLAYALDSLWQVYAALQDPRAAQVAQLRNRVDALARATHRRRNTLESMAAALVDALGVLDKAIDDAFEASDRQSDIWDG